MPETTTPRPLHQYEAFLHQLPAEWEQKEITQVGAVVGGGTPSREVPSFWRGPIPWVTPGEVSGEVAKLLHDTNDHISASGLAGSGANLLPAGSLMVTTRATLGARAINAVPMATNQGFKSIVFKKPEEASYYFHLFEKVKPELVRRASGTTFLEISGAEFGSIKVPSPSPDEKLKIAQLLDTLDAAIHKTEAIVEKLKQVKQGLLHDLLTRGIDANGQLRPSHEVAPHLYKQSPLGWIPQEWSAHIFGDLVQHVIDFRGRTPKKLGMDWGGGDILALSANNVQPGGIDVSREAYFGSERLYRKWMTSGETRTGDVLLTMEAPLGNVAQIPDSCKYILSQRVISLRFMADLVLNDFAFWQMQSNEFQQAMVKRSTGSTATGIQRAELVKLHFKSPPVGEQALIAERLFSIERKLKNEAAALVKQRQEKCGLMNDLLTGRVRVTPLLAQ
jgi:type I restriction enzyme S subunit